MGNANLCPTIAVVMQCPTIAGSIKPGTLAIEYLNDVLFINVSVDRSV